MMDKRAQTRTITKYCSKIQKLVKSTLRVPVGLLGWKVDYFSSLDFGYITASRKLSICEF